MPWLKRAGIALGAIALTIFLAIFLFVGFGWGLARGLIESRLSARLKRRVEITAIERVGPLSLSPLIEVSGVTIAQPRWAGRGAMVTLRKGRIRLPVLPLLVGRLRPKAISVEGAEISLVVDSIGRENWHETEQRASGGNPIELGDATIRDTRLSYADAKRDVIVRAALDSDGRRFALVGRGVIRGAPARLALTGPAVAGKGSWPFHLAVASGVVSLDVDGRTATPLDLGHLQAHVRSKGHDLRDLDRLIQAGLPASQDYDLSATIAHDRPVWTVTDLKGRIGRSLIAGHVTVDKKAGRSILDGSLVASQLDFDDLASDEGLAKARSREAALGPRLFPATRIRLDKLRNTDGRIAFEARRILSRTPSALRAISGVATLDHGTLTLSPVTATLVRGTVSGKAVVAHPDGDPRLSLDLTLANATLETLFTDAALATGPLRGRLTLTGTGDTVREAVGRANGRIGLVSQNGVIEHRIALFAASDVGRGAFAKAGEKDRLRCLVGGFSVAGGLAHPDPLVLDTDVGRADGRGTIRLADERLALSLTGRSRQGGGLKVDRPLGVAGTIEQPKLVIPQELHKAGGILKLLGRAIGGHQAVAAAPPTDCAPLIARALR